MRVPLVALAVAGLVAGAGCEDIRHFEGSWAGPVSADPAHHQGFAADAGLQANVTAVSRTQLTMTVALPTGPVPFEPIRHAADDALGDLRLEGEPLRTFLGYLRPAGADPYLTVVSFFAEERIDLRLIRGPDDAYGVFSLRRTHN